MLTIKSLFKVVLCGFLVALISLFVFGTDQATAGPDPYIDCEEYIPYTCGTCPVVDDCGPSNDWCCCTKGCGPQEPPNTPTPTNTPAPTNTPIPTPTPIPCAPILFPPDYECNKANDEDETATAEWMWTLTPVENPAQEYFFQVAYDIDFNSVDHALLCIQADQDICELYEGNQGRVIGPTNFFGNARVDHPEIIRFARVKVKRSFTACSTGGAWAWSNVVASQENCLNPDPEDGGGPTPRPLDKLFCNSEGEPTESPDTGEVFTAIGCLPADDVQRFTSFSLTWGMGIAGGVTLLMIVYAGFLFMTSGGNPQKLQAARELATASVGGLVYLLFAVFMFRLIGSDILKIPGL